LQWKVQSRFGKHGGKKVSGVRCREFVVEKTNKKSPRADGNVCRRALADTRPIKGQRPAGYRLDCWG
jgi:hypothetical protein